MRIDRSQLKKSTSEVPIECQALIDRLRTCTTAELLEELKRIDSWTFGKCELYHWIDVLDRCDIILEEAAMRAGENTWTLACDLPHLVELKDLLLWVLHFTTLLIEHSFSRDLYNSMERLIALLSSCNMHVVLGVLNLLYMFSKRSNFITRLDNEKRQALLSRLTYLAESWGGRDNGFGLADCCKDLPITHFPPSATTLHFEFYPEKQQITLMKIKVSDFTNCTPQIFDFIVSNLPIKEDKYSLFTRLRLTCSFSNYQRRLQCVQARLQALSVLVYSNALADNSYSLLYSGLMEELVELLEISSPELVEIRAAALRTLTSIIHLDRNPNFPHRKPGTRLNMIIDVTGAGSYHGFLPVVVRSCISSLTAPSNQNDKASTSQTAGQQPAPAPFPLPFATALFSFLYHLASYKAGGEALVNCGMMESLLQVINWPGTELEHITLVTRAVRVIDLITNIDMQAFQAHGGLNSFINRLELEVNTCRLEQPFEIIPPGHQNNEMDEEPRSIGASHSPDIFDHDNVLDMDTESPSRPDTDQGDNSATDSTNAGESSSGQTDRRSVEKKDSNIKDADQEFLQNFDYSAAKTEKTCLLQRAALLKSMLNFLKKVIQVEDPGFSDSIRRIMEGSLPSSLKHMISNAEYYGPSLFLLATDVVTVYVFQEPSLLSSLQDNGLTDVMLHALLVKEVPATREVLGSLPNMFSALCLNARGLQAFQKCQPFPRIFKVLISQTYLAAMRRRRSSEAMGDTAASLGNAMDELMRHQPTLKQPAMAAIIKLLEELCALGRNPKYVCWRAQNKQEVSPAAAPSNQGGGGGNAEGTGSSDEDDEDEEEASSSSHQPQSTVDSAGMNSASSSNSSTEKTPIALIDYIIHVMKFVDAILSNNTTDDHCREFITQNGLEPLLSVLGLPNLPVDYPVTTAAESVSSVCKSILSVTHDAAVLQHGLKQLWNVLQTLKPLYSAWSMGDSCSVLLQELVRAPSLENAFSTPSATPLLHAMTAAHGYVVMFVHLCRTVQADNQSISFRCWGSSVGRRVLQALSELYVSLIWESTLLCSDNILPPGSDFLKYTTPLLDASSCLERAMAELFGLLVKLCVGSPIRQRRAHPGSTAPIEEVMTTEFVMRSLSTLVARGLNPPATPIPKLRLTFLICSVGFTTPMLFDEKKFPYHLMLQNFSLRGGLDAFFETFRWALSAGGTIPLEDGLKLNELPEGTGEFLDVWLLLLEKLLNPRAILDTPHVIRKSSDKPFEPYRYLSNLHKLAFDALRIIIDAEHLPSYGGRMSESMLAVVMHILKGEKLLKEEEGKMEEAGAEEAGAEGASSSGLSRLPGEQVVPQINQDHLRSLTDMGFCRKLCEEALSLCSTLQLAADYILNSEEIVVDSAAVVAADSSIDGTPEKDKSLKNSPQKEADENIALKKFLLNVQLSNEAARKKQMRETLTSVMGTIKPFKAKELESVRLSEFGRPKDTQPENKDDEIDREEYSSTMGLETTVIPKIEVSESPLIYSINYKLPGVAFLFFFNEFCGVPDEFVEGNLELLERAWTTLENIKFKVSIYLNMTLQEFCDELETIAKSDHSAYSSFMVVVCSRGSDGGFLTADGEVFYVETVTDPFLPQNAQSLFGKPRLFLFEGCRGDARDGGVGQANVGKEAKSVRHLSDGKNASFQKALYLTSSHVDTAIFFSCWDGFLSHAFVGGGSVFLTSFFKELDQADWDDEFQDLVRAVISAVSQIKLNVQDEKTGNYFSMQTPCLITTLSKKWFLKEPHTY